MKLPCSARARTHAFRRSRWLGAVIAVGASLALSTPAARALPPEYLAGLALHPSDPKVMVVRWDSAGGGFLYTRDGGKTFRAGPSRAFYKYSVTGRAPIALGNDGKLLLAQGDGLFIDDGAGCFPADPAGKSRVADLAQHPDDLDTTFFVTTGNTKDAHAGLWKRDKAGALTSFGLSEPFPNMMPGIVVSGMSVLKRAASGEGLRFVEVGTRYTVQGTQMVPTSFFRFSDDMGASWTEHAIPDPGKTEGVARLLAVEGSEPMKVVVSLEVTGPEPEPMDPILYSVDNGQTFLAYAGLDLQIAQPSASLLLPNGHFFVGESNQTGGLWTADAIGAAPRKVAEYPVHCLGYQPKNSTMYMCKAYEFGVYDPVAQSFCGMFQMNQTVALACSSYSAQQLTDVQAQLCNAWCGPGHYAFSPLCSAYDNPQQVCGVQARIWDTKDPDPNKNWIEPPGDLSAPRCAGFEAAPDAGAPTAGSDAGVAVQDAGSAAADAAETGGGSNTDAGTEPKKKGSAGCQLAAHAAPAAALQCLMLSVLAGSIARQLSKRRRVQAR